MFYRKNFIAFNVLGFSLMSCDGQAAFAQTADDVTRADDELIVVTAPRIAGAVTTDIPPEFELDVAGIASYGASSIADLIAAIATQTGTGRGRGGGAPVVLLNGRRVSGFSEIRDLPPEAIKKVEVFAEDVALQYGYSADQRVVNFILKDDFSAATAELEYGQPTAGGRSEIEAQATYLKLTKAGRLNLSAQYDRDTSILESERNIIQAGSDIGRFRTLLPTNDAQQLNATLNRALSKTVSATLNLRYDNSANDALFGVSNAVIADPSITNFSPLARVSRAQTFHAGVTVDGNIDRWLWTLTANYDDTTLRSLTDRNVSNPLLLGLLAPDSARSQSVTTNGIYSVSGPLVQLPAGALTLSVRAGFEEKSFNSESVRVLVNSVSSLQRGEANGRISIDIPLADRGRSVASDLGDLSVNANFGYRNLTDFGSLIAFGYGLTWSPLKGLIVLASAAGEDTAPTPQQLGDPIIVTPNVTVFDFVRGQTASVTLISGGNAALKAADTRDIRVGFSYTPPSKKEVSFNVNYFRNVSRGPISSFPALTSAAEGAFPGRIIRDGSGALVAVDQRAVNFSAARNDVLRMGITFTREFGQPPQARGQAGSEPRSFGSGGGGGRGGIGRFGAGMGPGGRWQVSLIHSLRLRDDIVLAAGQPKLDLLNGDATGNSGGSSRHVIDMEGGWFNKGFGIRLIANYQSGTAVTGGSIPGGGIAPNLYFSDLLTANTRLYINFDNRKAMVAKFPFLKGSRLALRVNNLTNAIQSVRDSNGVQPLRYQSGYFNPLGRTFEISFRKIF